MLLHYLLRVLIDSDKYTPKEKHRKSALVGTAYKHLFRTQTRAFLEVHLSAAAKFLRAHSEPASVLAERIINKKQKSLLTLEEIAACIAGGIPNC